MNETTDLLIIGAGPAGMAAALAAASSGARIVLLDDNRYPVGRSGATAPRPTCPAPPNACASNCTPAPTYVAMPAPV